MTFHPKFKLPVCPKLAARAGHSTAVLLEQGKITQHEFTCAENLRDLWFSSVDNPSAGYTGLDSDDRAAMVDCGKSLKLDYDKNSVAFRSSGKVLTGDSKENDLIARADRMKKVRAAVTEAVQKCLQDVEFKSVMQQQRMELTYTKAVMNEVLDELLDSTYKGTNPDILTKMIRNLGHVHFFKEADALRSSNSPILLKERKTVRKGSVLTEEQILRIADMLTEGARKDSDNSKAVGIPDRFCELGFSAMPENWLKRILRKEVYVPNPSGDRNQRSRKLRFDEVQAEASDYDEFLGEKAKKLRELSAGVGNRGALYYELKRQLNEDELTPYEFEDELIDAGLVEYHEQLEAHGIEVNPEPLKDYPYQSSLTMDQIAEAEGVHKSTISKIKRGLIHSHITGIVPDCGVKWSPRQTTQIDFVPDSLEIAFEADNRRLRVADDAPQPCRKCWRCRETLEKITIPPNDNPPGVNFPEKSDEQRMREDGPRREYEASHKAELWRLHSLTYEVPPSDYMSFNECPGIEARLDKEGNPHELDLKDTSECLPEGIIRDSSRLRTQHSLMKNNNGYTLALRAAPPTPTTTPVPTFGNPLPVRPRA